MSNPRFNIRKYIDDVLPADKTDMVVKTERFCLEIDRDKMILIDKEQYQKKEYIFDAESGQITMNGLVKGREVFSAIIEKLRDLKGIILQGKAQVEFNEVDV